MTTPLYRHEVLAAKRNRWLGPLLLRQPVSHWVATWASIVLVAAGGGFLCVGEDARKSRVAGRLVARAPAVAASQEPALEAELVVPERLLASVSVGDEVRLRYRAYPYQRYGQYAGRIVRVGSTPLPADVAGTAGETAYAATVALTDDRVRDDRGVESALRPGLGVDAEIVVDKRRLYQWLFEPLASRRGREDGRVPPPNAHRP